MIELPWQRAACSLYHQHSATVSLPLLCVAGSIALLLFFCARLYCLVLLSTACTICVDINLAILRRRNFWHIPQGHGSAVTI